MACARDRQFTAQLTVQAGIRAADSQRRRPVGRPTVYSALGVINYTYSQIEHCASESLRTQGQ